MSRTKCLLEVEHAVVKYPRRDGRGELTAVNDVSFVLQEGQTLGIVGESGSGKSSLARAVIGLYPLSGGCVKLNDIDVASMSPKELTKFRRTVQMVFQDSSGALNPRHRVGFALGEVFKVHGGVAARREREQRVAKLLKQVGLSADVARAFPHELSGGQRQRIGLARALAVEPHVIIADEPVSALDVSVQAQILALMRSLQRDLGLAYLFIAHDLAVVKQVCDRVLVMKSGCVVEQGVAREVLLRPEHPYTQELLKVVPDVERGLARRMKAAQLPG